MKVKFKADKWGFYITPLIGYSWCEPYGKSIWLGWGRWLVTFEIKPEMKG
jgi:hypothetical protein